MPVNLNEKKPKFSASEVLQVYIENSSTIFSEKKSTLFGLFQSKYANFYKAFLMDSFEFRKFYLTHSLTELVVPAVKKEYLNKTYIFSSYDARVDKNKNFSLYDVLMSTTAAPMFFPPHEIPKHGIFFDGKNNNISIFNLFSQL
jgi:patatin-like phospholipase/acyl hydrolase